MLNSYSQKLQKLISRNTLLTAILLALCLIVFGVGLGWYNNKVVARTTTPIALYKEEPSNPLSFMANWDSVDYINLSKSGYQAANSANFYPLYPLLIHYVTKVLRSPLDSGIFISWICLVGAIYYYLRILKTFFKVEDNISAIKGLVFFVLFPTSVFFLSAYASSLLVFTGLACIYYALSEPLSGLKTGASGWLPA
ncbi:MAG: mannosyltransferase family protein [Candidatus Saccharimonadales bacterium]